MTKPKPPVPTRITESGRIVAEVRPGRWLDAQVINASLGLLAYRRADKQRGIRDRYQAALKAIETLADAENVG